jgi:hypothetical protein
VSDFLRIERGVIGKVEPAHSHYIGGGQSEEQTGWTAHWQPDDSRGEWEQHVPLAYIEGERAPEPGDRVFCLSSPSGGLVRAFVYGSVVPLNTSGLEDDELLVLAANAAAVCGGMVPDPAPLP